MRNIILLLSLAVPLLSFTTIKKSPVETKQTTALRVKLNKITKYGYAFGHQDDTNYGKNWHYEEGRSDVKDVCGDYPGVIGFDLGHIELDSCKNLDGVPFDKIRKEAVKQYLRGGIVTISWHLNNPVNGKSAWDVCDNAVASVLKGGTNYQEYQKWLSKVAKFLNSIVTPKGIKVPILFRPYHENTGSWFWWGAKFCTPEEYKALWHLTESTFKTHGVNNVLYVYSPGGGSSEAQYMERYPGDSYVDILGVDIYQMDKDETFVKDVQYSFDFMTKVGKEHHKIIAFTETGFLCIPEANWWTKVLMPVIDKYPISYVMVWRNAWDRKDHFYGPYKGLASEPDFVKFYQSSKTLFVKDMNRLNH
jgi:mannan endo-1,4-beta-mannosidase